MRSRKPRLGAGREPFFDSTSSAVWPYDQGPRGLEAFRISPICLSPQAADRGSVGIHIFDGQLAFEPKEIHNEHQGTTVMIDNKFACLRTYQSNIDRYHRLLKTELSELERQFIERRLNEEKSAMESLANVMATRTQAGKTPREHFVKTVHDELAKFERKEIEFQKMERDQRAARLRLPIDYPPRSTSPRTSSSALFRHPIENLP